MLCQCYEAFVMFCNLTRPTDGACCLLRFKLRLHYITYGIICFLFVSTTFFSVKCKRFGHCCRYLDYNLVLPNVFFVWHISPTAEEPTQKTKKEPILPRILKILDLIDTLLQVLIITYLKSFMLRTIQ